MREFIRFMLGRYWNDMDSNFAGGRPTLIFCWLMLLGAFFTITVGLFKLI